MTPSPDGEPDTRVDDLVRTACAVRPGAAERIVGRALAPAAAAGTRAAGRGRRLSLRAILAAGVAVLLLGAALSLPFRQAPEPQAQASPRGAMWNEGPVMIIAVPGDPITILGSGGSALPAPRGTASVELLGEPR